MLNLLHIALPLYRITNRRDICIGICHILKSQIPFFLFQLKPFYNNILGANWGAPFNLALLLVYFQKIIIILLAHIIVWNA